MKVPTLALATFFLITSNGSIASDSSLGLAVRELDNARAISLAPCQSTSSCVTSYRHRGVAESDVGRPFQTQGTLEQSRDQLVRLLLQDKAELVQNTPEYIHAVYKSRIFRFVDDVEFHFTAAGEIHYRSSSRSRSYDFGVSKKRIESLRYRYNQRI
jgi:uncharacterized protein (DUF1499 family)